MTEQEQLFIEKLNNPAVREAILYKAEITPEGTIHAEPGGLVILHLNRKMEASKIQLAIKSDHPEERVKIYYALAPKDEYSEDGSCLLGFFDGQPFEKIVDFHKAVDSIRLDFGSHDCHVSEVSIGFENVATEEIQAMRKEEKARRRKSIIKHLCRLSLIKYFLKHGPKATVERMKLELNDDKKSDADNTSQVIEPYTIKIKQPLQPNRKKVLHIIENFYTGGSSRLIIDIIEYNGHLYDNKVFTMAFRGESEFKNADVTVIDVKNKEKVLQQIKEYDPDIIHVHIWHGDWYRKVFSILDELESSDKAEGRERSIIENINTPVAPIKRDYIKKYVFVSQYVLDTFYGKADEKTEVIYPGSNFTMFTRELEGDYLAKDTIGMVYRLDYDKLNQNSIDVFIKTIQKRPRTKAVIVGGGPQYELYVKKAKDAGVYENFTFTGYVPYVTLPDLYKKFTIFVAPVWQESFGQVSPFAMSMGIPVAGYDIGALSEILDGKEYLAKGDDSDALSDILVKLLDNYELCKKLGKEYQERAHKFYAVKTMTDEYLRLYDGLNR